MHHRPRLTSWSTLRPALVAVLALAGCAGGSGADAVQPGPQAGDTGCTALTARLPGRLLGQSRVQLDVAGAAAWGSPRIVLRCGVESPGPTSDPCLSVDGIDWLFIDRKSTLLFLSYGRRPAVELSVPSSYGREQAPGALSDLTTAVSAIPASRHCT